MLICSRGSLSQTRACKGPQWRGLVTSPFGCRPRSCHMNLASFTPLDVLLGSWPQNGDLFLGEMIRAAGGKTAAEVLSKSEPDVIRDSISSNSASRILAPRTSLWQPHCLCINNDIEEATLEFHKEKKEKEYNLQILLLVAMLVATVTFQAALNPPGGFKSDDIDDGISRGRPLLGEVLDCFLELDMIALLLSVSVMMFLLRVVPRKKKIVMKFLVMVIWGATFSMGMAFTGGIYVLYNKFYEKTGHWYSLLLYAWFIVLSLGVYWVLVRILIFLLKKSGLWQPIQQSFALLKRGCFLKWQQFSNITKINGSNSCEFFKKVICIILIFSTVPAGISLPWLLFRFMRLE